MPYITKDRREAIEKGERPRTVGELNFFLTRVCCCYIEDKGESYQTVNDIVGALECAKLEFYRRVAIPYEEKKIIANGDVYAD